MSEFSAALKELAEPWHPGDRIKTAIDKAARQTGLSYWRTFEIWYGRAKRIDADEAAKIARAVEKNV